MPGGGRTIYIAGAGIAGLTLALALAKFGATVIVLERHSGIQEFGAGVQISPNARRVLNQLGLDRQIATHSFEPEGIDLYGFRSKTPIQTLKLGATARGRFGAPYAVMHRPDLADALYRACRRFASVDVVFGVRSFDAVAHARGVSVSVDEAGGRTRNARAFAFVGADGVNSPTRTQILGGPRAEPQNRAAWRTLLDLEKTSHIVAQDRTSVLFGPGYHAVCYPLPRLGKLNVALFAKLPGDRSKAPVETEGPRLPRSILPSQRFDALMEAAAGRWSVWPLATVGLDDWHHGGIGLIGDAAHAMVPFQAQGAAMAIEDAAILAPLLMTEPRAEQAFERFVAMRRARIDRVTQTSIHNGMAFHLDWPFSVARDAVLRLQGPEAHLKRLAWLYGYDAAPDVEPKVPPRPALPASVEREHPH